MVKSLKKVEQFRVVAIDKRFGIKHVGPIANGRSEACDAFEAMMKPFMAERYQKMNCYACDFMRSAEIVPVA